MCTAELHMLFALLGGIVLYFASTIRIGTFVEIILIILIREKCIGF